MRQLFYVCLVMLAGACSARSALAVSVTDFIDYSLRDAGGNLLLPGRLYVPPEASADSTSGPRPFMMFLHGGGGSGTDNLAQLPQVSDQMLSQARQRGAFLYLPQTANSWSTQTVTDRVMTMIDRAIDDLNADTHRVYISGYSLGAFGTWTMLSRYDGRFAAGIPISGGSTASDFVAAKLVDTPILALHARDDSSAAAAATRSNVSGILGSAGEPLPTYLSISDPKDFFISNPSLPLHAAFVAQAHQIANVTDFFLSNSTLDLMYYERATGGHSGVLPFMNSPEVYTWLFDHSTVVPEPALCTLLLIGGIVAPSIRRRSYSR